MRWILLTGACLLLGAVHGGARAQDVTLRGFVTDRADGQPLQGANVVLRDVAGPLRGTVTDKDGYYQIPRISPARYAVQISFVGYTTFRDTLMLAAAFVTLSVELGPVETALDEIVVATEGGVTHLQGGLQTIRPADLARIPTPDADGDLAGYLQSLPGVIAVGDRGGQLFIRGGTPAQNLVLVDGMVLFQPFHIVGFFSALPEDIVSHADFYAGGFGARYSGRISSVIDVSTREGNKQFYEGAVSLSPFLATVRAEGPIKRGQVSFIASLRRSVIEPVSPVLPGKTLPFSFGDLFVKVHHTDRRNSRCSATLMHTYDRGRIDIEAGGRSDVFRWNNFVLGGRCIAFPEHSPYLIDLNTGLSYVRNEVGNSANPERRSHAIRASTEVNLTRFLGRAELHFGVFARMNWLGFRLGDQFQNLRAEKDAFFGTGLYFEALLHPHDRLQMTPGLAVTSYPLNFGPSLEPRFRLRWQPDEVQEVNLALGLYEQTLVGISDERDAGSAFIAWTPPPVERAQSRAWHALLGYQRRLGPHLRLVAEGYYKRLRNLAVPIWSTIARFTTELTLARGTVYGLDTRLTYQRGPLYFYAGYGYSWTRYLAQQDNFGVWFGEPVQHYHPPHDRRHQLNAVAGLTLNRFRLNLRWQFGSGLPFTRSLGFDDLIPLRTLTDVKTFLGTSRVLYEKPYRGRLPGYHRLDVSAERTFPTRAGRLTVQLGVLNLYDRDNLFYFDLFTVRRVDQLPFLPTLSLKFETR